MRTSNGNASGRCLRAGLRSIWCLGLLLFSLWGWAANRVFIEAETMEVDGKTWVTKDHFGGWYSGVPSGGKMIGGAQGEQGEAKKTGALRTPGTYKLWVRYLDVRYRGPFKISVWQNGTVVGEKVFDAVSLRETAEGKKKWGDGYAQFVWDSLTVTLAAGKTDIIVTKDKPLAAVWVTRHLDCLVLTDDLAYEPHVSDFFTPLYLKIKAGPAQTAPMVVHVFGKHPRAPWFIPHHNIYKTGLVKNAYTGYKADGKNETFLRAGDETPWMNIAPLLDGMGDNALQLTAIQEYLVGLPTADFTAYLSNTPSDAGIFKTVSRSGSGAGLLLLIDLTAVEKTRSGLECSKANADAAAKLPPTSGKRAKAFPLVTGCAIRGDFYEPAVIKNEIDTLTALGINGIGGYDPAFFAKGFTQITGHVGFFHLTNNGCQNDPKVEAIRATITGAASKAREDGTADHTYTWSLMDEPGAVSLDHIVGCPTCAAAFRKYLQDQKLQPATFGKKTWEEVLPVKEGKSSPELYYYTVNFRSQTLTNYFKLATAILRETAPDARTSANLVEDLTFSGNGLRYGADWFQLHEQGALRFGWTEDWLSYSTTYQLCGYRADYLRAASRGQGFGIYNILRSPWDTQLKTATEIGHGAQVIHYYNYGPDYSGAPDARSDNYALYPALREINYAVGKVEDYLLNATVPPSKIGLLYSHATDIWTLDEGNSTQGKERMGLYLLLRHLGYPVEFVTEKDIIEKRLSPYRMLFVTGSHLPRAAVQPLLQWVQQGGRLYLGAGSLCYDEFNRPLQIDAALGLTRKPYENKENVGREIYEVPKLKVLDTVTFRGKALEGLCGLQKMELAPDARALATFADASPALLHRPLGKGQLFCSGFYPGIAYLKSGVLAKQALAETLKAENKTATTYNPPAYAEEYRQLTTALLDGVGYAPPVVTGHYLVEGNVLEGEKGVVVALANWSGEPVKDLKVMLPLTRKIGKPITGINAIKAWAQQNGQVTVTLDLGAADFLVLPY